MIKTTISENKMGQIAFGTNSLGCAVLRPLSFWLSLQLQCDQSLQRLGYYNKLLWTHFLDDHL